MSACVSLKMWVSYHFISLSFFSFSTHQQWRGVLVLKVLHQKHLVTCCENDSWFRVSSFEVTSISRTRGREEIELEIRGPSCLQELREEGKGILQFLIHILEGPLQGIYISYEGDKDPTTKT